MSATGRGRERNAHDEYLTPDDCAAACMETIPWADAPGLSPGWTPPRSCLEPSAGRGAFIRAGQRPGVTWTASELQRDPAMQADIVGAGAGVVHMGQDFTRWLPDQRFDFIGGNPPYVRAQSFLEQAMFLLSERGLCAFLLRVNFLIAEERLQLLERFPPVAVLALQPRVPFLGEGSATDATDYAWIIWRRADMGRADVITRFGRLWWRQRTAEEENRRRVHLAQVRALDWTR